VLQKIFVVAAQKVWADFRLQEPLMEAVWQLPAEWAPTAELVGQPADFEPEPGIGPAEQFAAVQPALAPAAWQEVEPEPSVSERWYWANLGSALVGRTAEQRRRSLRALPSISSGACLASRYYLLTFHSGAGFPGTGTRPRRGKFGRTRGGWAACTGGTI